MASILETLSADGFSESILLQEMPNKAYGGNVAVKHGNVKFVGTLTLQISYDQGKTFKPIKTYAGSQIECIQAWNAGRVRIGFAENDYISGEAVIHLSSELSKPRRNRVKMRSMV